MTPGLTLSPLGQLGVGTKTTTPSQGVDASHDAHLAEFVREHVDFVWRSLGRLGVPHSELDDAVQEVFMVASRRWNDARVNPRGFLFRTGMNVAAHVRRTRARRRESGEEPSENQIDPSLLADEKLDHERARVMLNHVLERMPLELRTVFMLYELEELTMAEIADLLGLRPGTVASRLRRAREEFFACVRRIEAARGRRA